MVITWSSFMPPCEDKCLGTSRLFIHISRDSLFGHLFRRLVCLSLFQLFVPSLYRYENVVVPGNHKA